MEKLTQQEIEEYVEAFKCFDLNENGQLSTKELKYAMRMLGLNPTEHRVQELVNDLDYEALGDKDEAGNVKTNETENDKRRKRRKSKEDEKMKGEKWTKEDFPIYEGTVDFKEFVNLMEKQRSIMQDDEAAMLFTVFDSDHRGFIEGKTIKRSLHFLEDVPIDEINEILAKTKLSDDRKITIEEFATDFLSPLILKEENSGML